MAQLLQVALVALRLARNAYLPAVVDDLVREVNPPILRYHLHQFLLHFLRRVAFRQAQPVSNSEDMCINNYTLSFPEADAQNDVRSFPRCARNGDQLGKGLRNLAAEIRDDLRSRPLDGLRLVAKKSSRLDERLKLRQCRFGDRRWGREALEQLRRDEVDANVSALCGKDRRHQ